MSCAFVVSCSLPSIVDSVSDDYPIDRISVSKYQKGQSIGKQASGPMSRIAGSDMEVVEGRWKFAKPAEGQNSNSSARGGEYSSWTIEVNAEVPAGVKSAIVSARNGYEAKLGYASNATLRICPRFERKSFSWGQAVSFLSQYQNDNTNYVPNNSMLRYEIHGLTKDGKYLRAVFGVTHPELASFGDEVRDYPVGDPAEASSAMQKDKHYQLVESAPADSFAPSLREIDCFVDGLDL